MSEYHDPVLVAEVIAALEPLHPGTVLDGTVGGGGHALAILEHFPAATLLGADRDADALAAAGQRLTGHADRIRLVQATLDSAIAHASVLPGTLSGVLVDLGVSGHQLDEDARGFTFRRDAPLDMRMDREDARTAADRLNEASANELTEIFREYGDVPRAGRLAQAVVRRRERQALRTSDDLVGALASSLDRAPSAREKARVFQAVRVWLNAEIDSLVDALPAMRDALRAEGTLVVISYHSVEDRVVKRAFREWSRECVCPPGLPVCACRGVALGTTLTRRPVTPSDAEVEANPRARSARLRAWRKAA